MMKSVAPETAVIFLILSFLFLLFAAYFAVQFFFSLPKTSRIRTLKMLFLPLLLVAAIFLASFITDRNEVCVLCHGDNSLEKPHAKIPCVRCHKEEGLSGELLFKIRQARMFLSFKKYRNGMSSVFVSPSECLECHQEIRDGVAGRNIRVRHKDFLSWYPCIECHEKHIHAVLRISSNPMSICLNCHSSPEEGVKCRKCHREERSVHAYEAFLGFTHTVQFISFHGFTAPGACSPCHSTGRCFSCHEHYPHSESFRINHGREAKDSFDSCRNCHLIARCNDCHAIEMPHPENWSREHGKSARKSWNQICSRCHAQANCLSCHEPEIFEKSRTQGKKDEIF